MTDRLEHKRDMMSEHEHQFPEERTPNGTLILLPCLFCGEAAGAVLAQASTELHQLRHVVARILANPYGCSFCDSGTLRTPNNPAKDHDEDCGFMLAARSGR